MELIQAIEEEVSYRALRESGLSYREVSDRTGKSLARVYGPLRVIEYDEVREAVAKGRVSVADAVQLARIEDRTERGRLLRAVEAGEVGGEALRMAVRAALTWSESTIGFGKSGTTEGSDTEGRSP